MSERYNERWIGGDMAIEVQFWDLVNEYSRANLHGKQLCVVKIKDLLRNDSDAIHQARIEGVELERELRESEAERETAANDRIAAQELHERELEAAKADVRRMREALQVMVDVFHPSRSADETEYIQTQAHEFARAALAAEE